MLFLASSAQSCASAVVSLDQIGYVFVVLFLTTAQWNWAEAKPFSGCLTDDAGLNLPVPALPPRPPAPHPPPHPTDTQLMWKKSHNCWSVQLDPSLIVFFAPSWSECSHSLPSDALWNHFPPLYIFNAEEEKRLICTCADSRNTARVVRAVQESKVNTK